MNKMRIYVLFLFVIGLLCLITTDPAVAQDDPNPNPPGWTTGYGTHFELPDSPYLPVILDTTAPVTLTLSSVPEVVDLTIEADSGTGMAEFTLGGFAANTAYFRYVDNGLDPVSFTTDDGGRFTYTQDLSQGHHVWFRDRLSTYFLYDDATGGDCAPTDPAKTPIGIWDESTKTCTLTTDVYQTIFIEGHGITLDGGGHWSRYSDSYYAVYSYGYNNITIRSLNVAGSTHGIWVDQGAGLTITNVTVAGGYYGIFTNQAQGATITNNTLSGMSYIGIYNYNNFTSGDTTINGNTITDVQTGLYINSYYSFGTLLVSNNYVSGGDVGARLWHPNHLIVKDNTFANARYYGLWISNVNNLPVSVYNNNFITNATQIYVNQGSASFDMPRPAGGNYFSDWDEPPGCADLDNDHFCDSPYVFTNGQDNLPWTTQDGWLIPANHPPAVTVENDAVSISEGLTAVNSGTVSDPDDDAVVLGASAGSVTDLGAGSWSWSLAATDGPAHSQAVTIYADDGNGGAASVDFNLTVNNVAPTIENIGVPLDPISIDNQPTSVSATFSDPGAAFDEPYTCTVDYGDGTGAIAAAVSGASCSGPGHTYVQAGVYQITVAVSDKDGATGGATAEAYLVVYDADGGFVTGGGWIDSPAGAYTADPALSGKANFGFVSKYKRGATAPTGNTEFHFKVADLNFHSNTYQWLVVAGAQAKFKGIGAINGEGSYGFMISAVDEKLTPSTDVDLFRIKIWDIDNGDAVVYDNQFGAADDDQPITTIGGGSIVVHHK